MTTATPYDVWEIDYHCPSWHRGRPIGRAASYEIACAVAAAHCAADPDALVEVGCDTWYRGMMADGPRDARLVTADDNETADLLDTAEAAWRAERAAKLAADWDRVQDALSRLAALSPSGLVDAGHLGALRRSATARMLDAITANPPAWTPARADCPTCGGHGETWGDETDPDGSPRPTWCADCHGTGLAA